MGSKNGREQGSLKSKRIKGEIAFNAHLPMETIVGVITFCGHVNCERDWKLALL